MAGQGTRHDFLYICIFLFQHNRFCAEAREAEPEVLWVGDTLIQDLVNSHIWERHFCQMHSLNFGIAFNRTQHVLWRLQNGELETLAPKVIYLTQFDQRGLYTKRPCRSYKILPIANFCLLLRLA